MARPCAELRTWQQLLAGLQQPFPVPYQCHPSIFELLVREQAKLRDLVQRRGRERLFVF